ncbi:outer membrane lipid asymmetry maintenance protein MlaD [Leeia sp. TBRC 13508]|uniref:Outer membrane lipid asymmetry maintenance protein MlaD n=1 Tax=Leeia speluncae TaxID=2884804 RepID=A0ABS8D637_9NEIS|nr:outer membrane lipid asymmetry maintenance protein MlaD [Leeia speluncae]MCB6183676.1 outer membrane lipid asymmetry maintenance protein MlaD [Leeia speluncae]
MKRSTIDIWVGLFVAAGLAGLIFLALKVSSPNKISDDETIALTARFDNIGGLKLNAPVKSAGVVVGRVANIVFDPKRYQAAVTLKVDKSIPFSKDSSADILTAGLLGEQYIGLETGSDEQNLKNGDNITITSSALVLEQLISKFMLDKAGENKTAESPSN